MTVSLYKYIYTYVHQSLYIVVNIYNLITYMYTYTVPRYVYMCANTLDIYRKQAAGDTALARDRRRKGMEG